jgi:predicted DNA-binding mobile mystery protein A
MKPPNELVLIQVERRLAKIRAGISLMKVKPGWIRFIRQTLNMTLEKLADRAGVSKPTVAQAERGEEEGKITIATLKKMAAAMECEFVYAFVPKEPIETVIKKQATIKSKKILKAADTHMILENQQVEQDMKVRVARLTEELIRKGNIW